MDLVPGLVVADRFRLVRLLGQGGMGSIWVARDTRLDVPCAVKFIRADAGHSPEIRARFEREAKAAAQLRSPHVVNILDHGEWEYGPYIAMEYLEGEDLAARLKQRRVLTPHEVASIASQVGRALTKAHAAKLVHRDLKPGNIFLARDDDREIVKVLDFGIAKASATQTDGPTKTGALLGTPSYMSPEQVRGTKDVDHRSDLWSLAVVVYQCLTGLLPFHSTGLGELFMKIMNEPLPVPSHTNRVPDGFDAWWARAAERDPGKRFQSAKELVDALSAALGVAESGELGGRAPMPSTQPTPEPGVAAALHKGGTLPLPEQPPREPRTDGEDAATIPLPPPEKADAPTPVQPFVSMADANGATAARPSRTGLVIAAGTLVLVAGGALSMMQGSMRKAKMAAPGPSETVSQALPGPPSIVETAAPAVSATATAAPMASPSTAPASSASSPTTTAPAPPPAPKPPVKKPKPDSEFGF